jgi:hypothetical protein
MNHSMTFWFLAIPELLLPGYAWILISGLSTRFDSLEKLSLSFILSVSFTALFTAALSLLTPNYLFYSSAVSLALSVGAIALYLLLRRPSLVRSNFRLKVGFESLPLLLAIAVYAVILVLLFWSAPYYPSADSSDPVNHAQVVAAIISGGGRYVVLQGGLPRAGLVILNSLLLVYSSARVLFGNRKIAGATVLVGAFIFPVDAIHFVKVGTFANVVGDAVILAVLLLFFSYVKRPSLPLGLTLAFLGVAGAFMHSSFLIFLAALWVSIPLVYLISRPNLRYYLQGALFSIVGLLLLAAVLTPVFAWNFQQIYSSYVIFAHPSLLNSDFFFVTLYGFSYNFSTILGPISMATIGLALVLISRRQRHFIGPVFAAFWFIFLVLVSFLTWEDWRFILFSLLPATFLIGDIIGSTPGLITESRDLSERVKGKISPTIVPLALCALIISGGFLTSGFFGVISRAYDPSERARQQAIFDSMVWLKQNGCSSGVASVGLEMDYRYLPFLTGIQYVGDFDKPAGELQQNSQLLGFHCLAVAIASQNFQSFQLDSVFHEEYQNDVVALFTIS